MLELLAASLYSVEKVGVSHDVPDIDDVRSEIKEQLALEEACGHNRPMPPTPQFNDSKQYNEAMKAHREVMSEYWKNRYYNQAECPTCYGTGKQLTAFGKAVLDIVRRYSQR